MTDPQVRVWDERDRLHVHLFDGDENHTIAEWWDDDARQMFEDGFFRQGAAFEASVIAYAEEMQLMTRGPAPSRRRR